MTTLNPLLDTEFLNQLHKERERDIYARITLLTFDERPIEYIEGKVTGGSINLDGASAVRRSCSLTIVTANLDVNIYMLGLERKFKLEIGLGNKINSNYNDIIWFKQGTYITSTCNTSRQVANYSISIQGKDKMCLLNGDVGGNLPSSVDFSTMEYYSEDGQTILYREILIKDIIRNAVETYGGEQSYNIRINDLDQSGLELLEYRGDKPLYIFKRISTGECENITMNENMKVYQNNQSYSLKALKDNQLDQFVSGQGIVDNQKFYLDAKNQSYDNAITIVKAEYGDAIGYRQTDLVYAGDLVANIGETITSVLDKIKNMLNTYEYFYDIDGCFVFQKKKTGININWSPEVYNAENGVSYYENNKLISDLFFSFEDNDLITAFNNTPSLNNIKNDYSIWGKRKGTGGTEIPIHLRYAIDKKPIQYTTYDGLYCFIANQNRQEQYKDFGSIEHNTNNVKIIQCDWREILYQMALDYHTYRDINYDFFSKINYNNIIENTATKENELLYPDGRTKYEQYYTDIIGFWRSLYSPFGFYRQVVLTKDTYERNKYYTMQVRELPTTKKKDPANRFPIYHLETTSTFYENKIYYEKVEKEDPNCKPYSSAVINTPNLINFWIDFLDTTGELGRYSVRAIGQRSKNVNDTSITSIYYRKVPNLIYCEGGTEQIYDKKTGYSYINLTPALKNCVTISAQGKSAWEEMENFLNTYTYATENSQITSIPIYHIDANVKVSLKDYSSKVNGEYYISKITLPLAYNGTMSLTATKAVEAIY